MLANTDNFFMPALHGRQASLCCYGTLQAGMLGPSELVDRCDECNRDGRMGQFGG